MQLVEGSAGSEYLELWVHRLILSLFCSVLCTASGSSDILMCSQISEKWKWIWRGFRKYSLSSCFLGFFFRMCFSSLERLAPGRGSVWEVVL